MINTFLKRVTLVSCLLLVSGHVAAIDGSRLPKDRQSATGLYFTSVEASEHIAKHAAATLFLDIRDPVEIFTVGMPLVADHNVTFKYIDPTKWNRNRSTFAWRDNPNFTTGVSEQLENKGLTNADTIIVICGSGRRAAKAATALKKAGFSKVYSVTDGYPGWQKANLGWSRKLDMSKVLVK